MRIKINKKRPRIKINRRKGNGKGTGTEEYIPAEAMTAEAMSQCALDLDLIPDIMVRLPVKSLLRFRGVCKFGWWFISSPVFMKMHFDRFCADPNNEWFIIECLSPLLHHTFTVFNIESEEPPRELVPPSPASFYEMHLVGSCYGMVCLASDDDGIVLWNPALNMWKFVEVSHVSPEWVSYGFGYDSKASDFKVVRILYLMGRKHKKMWEKYRTRGYKITVQVYSANSNSWTTLKVDFLYKVSPNRNDVILHGNPYWLATIHGNEAVMYLVWFDVSESAFKTVSLSSLNLEKEATVDFVDFNGDLAAIVHDESDEGEFKTIDFWVYDNVELMWRHNYNPRAIDREVDFVCFSKNGKWLDSSHLETCLCLIQRLDL
ncbi:UNVERIFIED_CONTAM: F-box/kelch-repeat protein [Sesamum radiatum]|uniref:F-box/kelch-repeat protein n=1 Tax=Sesamum radiatum TaxID=300843 RepID=A0AAW2J1L9_SESRA